MKKLFLFAAALATLSFAACDKETDGTTTDDSSDQGGNGGTTAKNLIKSVNYVSLNPENIYDVLVEFSYDAQNRMTKAKSTQVYPDGEIELSETYTTKYSYTANKITATFYEVESEGGNDREIYESYMDLNAEGYFSKFVMSERSQMEYTYDAKGQLATHTYNGAVEHQYTWTDGNLTENYFCSDTTDNADKREDTITLSYNDYANDLNIDLALIAQMEDFDEFRYAFATDRYGKRSANLVSRVVSNYVTGTIEDNITFDYEYTFTDKQLTEIKITRAYREGLAEADKEHFTVTLEYYK